MPRTLRPAVLALCAALASLSPPPALAQDSPTPGGAVARSTPPFTVTLDFPGGSLANYLDAIRRAAGHNPANIMIRGDAADIQIAPVSLRDITIDQATELIAGPHSEGPRRYHVETSRYAAESAAGAAYLVVIHDAGDAAAVRPSRVSILTLRDLICPLPGDPRDSTVPAEVALTAVEAAVAVAAPEGQRSKIQFHAESGLLVLAGPPEAISAAEEVLDRIRSDVRARRERSRELLRDRGLSDPTELERRVVDAQANLRAAGIEAEQARAELRVAQARFDEMNTLLAAGSVPPSEARDAELKVANAHAALELKEVEVERAAKAFEHWQRALKDQGERTADDGSELDALRQENAMLMDRVSVLQAQIESLSVQLHDLQKRDSERN